MKKNVFLVHNTYEEKILFSDKIGGFVCPSLAVVDADNGFHSFGNITLVKNISTYDFAKNKAYDSDIYSSRYPSVFHSIDVKKAHLLNKELDKQIKDMKIVDHNGTRVSGVKISLMDSLYEMQHIEHYKHSIEDFKKTSLNSIDIRLLHAIDSGVEPVLILRPLFNGFLRDVNIKTINKIIDEVGERLIDEDCLNIVYKHIYPVVEKKYNDEVNRLSLLMNSEDKINSDKIVEHINFMKAEFDNIFSNGEINKKNHRVKINIISGINNVKNGIVDLDYEKTIKYLDKKLKINSFEPNKTRVSVDKFYDFVEGLVGGFYRDSYFFNKNGRAVKLTAESMLREMSFGLKNQESDTLDSAIQIKAEFANPINSVEKIASNINKLTTRKEYKSGLDEVNGIFESYVNDLRKSLKNQTMGFFDSEYIVSEFTKSFISNRRVVEKEFKDDFDIKSEYFELAIRNLELIMNKVGGLKVNYFEVKHKDVVSLSDFSAAIIPKNTHREVVEKLSDAGLKVVEYDDKNIDTNIKVNKNWVSAIKKVKEFSLTVNVDKNHIVESLLDV